MRLALKLIIPGAFLLAGCSSADHHLTGHDAGDITDGGEGIDAGTGDDDAGVRFVSSPLTWQVPESGLEDGFFATSWASGVRFFSTLDMDGDGRPDLVQTGDTERDGGFVWDAAGSPFWRVYLSSGAGFTKEPIEWSVPDSGLEDGFFFPAYAYGERYWATLDLNGDALPDLIQTADPERFGGYVWGADSSPYWRVFLNEGDRFAGSYLEWPVPDTGLADGFFYLAYANGSRFWTTMDIDGDGLPDLVHTGDTAVEGGHVWATSVPYWKVFLNKGNGFSTSAIEWAVPQSGLADGFFSASWASGPRYWTTLDINGDSRPDLVQTADSTNDGGIVWSSGGLYHWRVFLNGGDSFSGSPTNWSVPESGLADGFFSAAWADGARHWSTMDMDGDGAPELVQTADSTIDDGFVWDASSSPYWKVFRNAGDRFDLSATIWSVPGSGLDDGFFASAWASGLRWWSTFDLDGDGAVDLIQTGDSTQDGGFVWDAALEPYWKVFRGRP